MLLNPKHALMIDRYALTTAFALFKQNMHNRPVTFEVFYRKRPTEEVPGVIYAGTHYIKQYLNQIALDKEVVQTLKKSLNIHEENQFVDFISQFRPESVKIETVPEGLLVPPSVPLVTIEGPLAYALMIETPVLSILHLCTSAATTAFTFGIHSAGKSLIEMGLRRAYGLEAGSLVSFYSILSGFHTSSNMMVESMLDERSTGTMSHAYLLSYELDPSLDSLALTPKFLELTKFPDTKTFVGQLRELRKRNKFEDTNDTELKAYISFANAFPDNFVALLDTYNTLGSGIKNFSLVAAFLDRAGIKRLGVRLDSGDLGVLSIKVREFLKDFDKHNGTNLAANTKIVASNDINIPFLKQLKTLPNELDVLGIGTNASTFSCLKPIGFVFKITEVDSVGTYKLSDEVVKSYFPYRKKVFLITSGNRVFYLVTSTGFEPAVKTEIEFLLVDKATSKFQPIKLVVDSFEELYTPLKDIEPQAYRKRIEQSKELIAKENEKKLDTLFSKELIDKKDALVQQRKEKKFDH